MSPPEPAELELSRVAALSRAGLNDLTLGTFLVIISGLVMFALMSGGYTPMKLMSFLFIVNALGWIPLFMGIRRLRRASTPADEIQDASPSRIPALPPKPVAISVTEKTTELFENAEDRAAARLQQSSRDTA
jgi:hypothetical protein